MKRKKDVYSYCVCYSKKEVIVPDVNEIHCAEYSLYLDIDQYSININGLLTKAMPEWKLQIVKKFYRTSVMCTIHIHVHY